jgi:hypothetical protein
MMSPVGTTAVTHRKVRTRHAIHCQVEVTGNARLHAATVVALEAIPSVFDEPMIRQPLSAGPFAVRGSSSSWRHIARRRSATAPDPRASEKLRGYTERHPANSSR